MRERFNIKKEDFPVYKLFIQGQKEPIEFKGEIKSDELTRFAKQEAGLWIGMCSLYLVGISVGVVIFETPHKKGMCGQKGKRKRG